MLLNKKVSFIFIILISTGFLLLILKPALAENLELKVTEDMEYYPPNSELVGYTEIIHDYPLGTGLRLYSYYDDSGTATLKNWTFIDRFLPNLSTYNFVPLNFIFNMTRQGRTHQVQYPEQEFNYTIKIEGTCGYYSDEVCTDPDRNDEDENGYANEDDPACRPYYESDYCGYPPHETVQEGYCLLQSISVGGNRMPCTWVEYFPSQVPPGDPWMTSSITKTNITCQDHEGNYSCSQLEEKWDISNKVNPIISRVGINETSIVYSFISVVPPNPRVDLSMRKTCGNSQYLGEDTEPNGWIINMDITDDLAPPPPSCGWSPTFRVAQIDMFDTDSLKEERSQYADHQIGGIYKVDSEGTHYVGIQDGAKWDGMADLESSEWGWGCLGSGYTGIIRVYIERDEPGTRYFLNYLPPYGTKLCAYTNYEEVNVTDWEKTKTFSGQDYTLNYADPYYRQFTENELVGYSQLANPPCQGEYCSFETLGYLFSPYSEHEDMIDFDFNESSLEVTAITDNQNFSLNYTVTIGLDEFPLYSPLEAGDYGLIIKLATAGEILIEDNTTFNTCVDADNDGYCSETWDCNDNDANIKPGVTDICDGLDNDCDGDTDEDVTDPEKPIGQPCAGQPNSACYGEYVCNSDGSGVVCNAQHIQGQLTEVCDNGIDDDCDGIIDETAEIYGAGQDCGCPNGVIRDCGSTLGACEGQTGYSICENNRWSSCRNEILPEPEECNRIDDDCDGTIDDVNEGTSVTTSNCGCYNNHAPQPEEDNGCNDIDDDCDGIIDEGLFCCIDGTTRVAPGSTDEGQCVQGTQTCINSAWGPCEGCVYPSAEECDELDNDCDGSVDEGDVCEPRVDLCNNGIRDQGEEDIDCGGPCPRECADLALITYLGLAIGIIIIILLLMILALKGKF